MTLVLNDITLTHADGDEQITALDHVDLSVVRGEFVAVVGPSGSGKSSLLAVAGTLLTPDSGRVEINGVDATSLGNVARTKLRREQLGFVFQGTNLIPSLTALDQLLAVVHLNGERPRDARAKAERLLGSVGLAGKIDRRPHQLSGGERQRIGIARALMNDPAVLLVDEPTSALDHDRGAQIVELLADVTHSGDVATVMVTHDSALLGAVDRVTTMQDGILTETASVQRSEPTPALQR